MTLASPGNKTSALRSLLWLALAAICIVFSSASKKVIEQKINPVYYHSALAFNKKVKDGCRDRHEYLAHVAGDVEHLSPADLLTATFFLAGLVFLASGYLSDRKHSPQYRVRQIAFAGVPLLRHQHRWQV